MSHDMVGTNKAMQLRSNSIADRHKVIKCSYQDMCI